MKSVIYTCDRCRPNGVLDLVSTKKVSIETLIKAKVPVKIENFKVSAEDPSPLLTEVEFRCGIAFDQMGDGWEHNPFLEEDICNVCVAEQILLNARLEAAEQSGVASIFHDYGLGRSFLGEEERLQLEKMDRIDAKSEKEE